MAESKEELEAKVSIFEGQLSQVELLLAADPENEQFLKLKSDCATLLSVTNELLVAHTSSADESPDADDDDMQKEIAQLKEQRANVDVDVNVVVDNVREVEAEKKEFNTGAGAGATHARPGVERKGPLVMGDIVEVQGPGRVYPGHIVSVLEGEKGFRVKYYEYETEVELPNDSSISRMKSGPLSLHNAAQLEESLREFQGQCKWPADQLYYDVTMIRWDEQGVFVKYPSLNNDVVYAIPVAYLRPNLEKRPRAMLETKTNPKLMEVPEKYLPLPTDTEEEKLRKQKKIKSIKNKNRIITKESEGAAVQQSWQKFVKQSGKRGLAGVSKTSMFTNKEGSSSSGYTKQDQKKRNRTIGATNDPVIQNP